MAKGGFYGGDGQAGTPIRKESETQRPIGSPWRTLGGGAASFGIFCSVGGIRLPSALTAPSPGGFSGERRDVNLSFSGGED